MYWSTCTCTYVQCMRRVTCDMKCSPLSATIQNNTNSQADSKKAYHGIKFLVGLGNKWVVIAAPDLLLPQTHTHAALVFSNRVCHLCHELWVKYLLGLLASSVYVTCYTVSYVNSDTCPTTRSIFHLVINDWTDACAVYVLYISFHFI